MKRQASRSKPQCLASNHDSSAFNVVIASRSSGDPRSNNGLEIRLPSGIEQSTSRIGLPLAKLPRTSMMVSGERLRLGFDESFAPAGF